MRKLILSVAFAMLFTVACAAKVNVNVRRPPLIVADAVADVNEGQAFSFPLQISGGKPGYTCAADSTRPLPSWAQVSLACVISGTPPAGSGGATYSFAIVVTDAAGTKVNTADALAVVP